jgi:heme a synthase
MIVLGGIVRLAHAGLSIVEWHPVAGILPPLSEGAWAAAFEAYRATPEYRLVNDGMSMAAFRNIYWLEYLHRVLGRLAGLLLVLPLAIGLVRRSFDRATATALVGIAVLFAMQGVMGWLMVASGLKDQPWVSPYRLLLHLWLAFALLALVVWQLFTHAVGRPATSAGIRLQRPATVALVALVAQTGIGALVAGHRAGWVSDTFPRMQGRWIPDGIGSMPGWVDLVANPLTVHFEHRWFAFVVLAAVLWLHGRARTTAVTPVVRRLATAAAALTALQVALGITVVLTSVPVALASLHQAAAAVLLGVLVAVVHQTREPLDSRKI